MGESVRESRSSPFAVIRKSRTAWGRFAPMIAGAEWKIVVLAFGSVAAGLSEAALLALVVAVAGALSQGQNQVDVDLGFVSAETSMSAMLTVCLILAVARGALQVFLAYPPAAISARAMARLRRLLFDVYTNASWATKAAQRDGYFQSLMNAHVTNACQAILLLGTGFTAAAMFLTLVVSAFVLSVTTAVILIAFSLMLFVGLRPLARRLRRHAGALSAETVEYSKGVQEVVLMAEETEVFGVSDSYRGSFYRLVEEVRLPLLRTRFLSRAVPALYQSVAFVTLVIALIGVSFVDTNEIVTLGAVVMILVRSLTYGQQLQAALSRLDEVIPFIHRLFDAVDDYAAGARHDGGEPLARITELSMHDVRFGYPGGPDVLHDVTFTVARGEAIGMAGPSGAGKSSIVQLLLRLRTATVGEVRVNGEDVRAFRREDWQRQVAYVPQSPQIIWGTVADNIRFYRDDLTPDDIELAARRANIHDEIQSWPHGYGTIVGQRAAGVSGGQRQRLCMARALAGDPEVLILDEATSALDVKSESLIQETLTGLKGEITLFVVGHRLSTLSFCDRIMVVVDGRLDGFAEPEVLLAESDFYREVDEISKRQTSV